MPSPCRYAIAVLDSESNYLDGGKNYKLTIPANPPAKNFWSITVYDAQTRSMLQTDQQFPALGSYSAGLQKNPDGSYELYSVPTRQPAKRVTGFKLLLVEGGSRSCASTAH